MPAPRESVILELDKRQIDKFVGLVAYNAGRKFAQEVKKEAQSTCPVDTGNLRDKHEVVYLGKLGWAVIADTDYANFVHDGTRSMAARPWLTEAQDRVAMKRRMGR